MIYFLTNPAFRKCLSKAFLALFVFASVFAHCFHSSHYGGHPSDGTAILHKDGQAVISCGAGMQEGCVLDCPACTYLGNAQGYSFEEVQEPKSQGCCSHVPSLNELFHITASIEYLPRAPPAARS